MHHKTFIDKLDDTKIVAAIERAERGTTGEIRVCVSHQHRDDALTAAQKRFAQLGLAKTPHRNAVLIYFDPQARKFAVWGDTGVHEKCGDAFWQDIAAEIAPKLKSERYTEAVVDAVGRIGELLAKHFPRGAGDGGPGMSNAVVRE